MGQTRSTSLVHTLVAAFPSGPENADATADATELAIWVNADVMACITLRLLSSPDWPKWGFLLTLVSANIQCFSPKLILYFIELVSLSSLAYASTLKVLDSNALAVFFIVRVGINSCHA